MSWNLPGGNKHQSEKLVFQAKFETGTLRMKVKALFVDPNFSGLQII
jgi:hypothetical protein